MSRTEILCPGIPTTKDEKNPNGVIHYLKISDPATGNKMCDQSGCMFVLKTKDDVDVWRSDYMPATIK